MTMGECERIAPYADLMWDTHENDVPLLYESAADDLIEMQR